MENIEIHVIDHCNLNCAHCDNFAPIAKPWTITIESFKKQLKQLASIGEVKEIRLMGGEPLLHPEIITLMREARAIFKYSKITLLTNGILLQNMDDEFWLTLIECKISIWLSIYEQGDYCIDKIHEYGIELRTSHEQTLVNPCAPLFHNLSLDLTGQSNGWDKCYLARGRCTTLRDGKIYPCECASLIDIFNKKFKTKLKITDADYMDIYKNTIEEIEDFLKRPIPFCKYCNTDKRNRRYYPHKKSTGEIGEWT